MLSEQHRQQLDGIVQQMVANKESDNTIQFVVSDFKSKYDPSVATANVKPKVNTLGQRVLGVGKGIEDFVNQNIAQPFVDIAAMPVQGLAKKLGQPDPYANNAMAGIRVNPIDDPLRKTGSAIEIGANFLPVGRMASGATKGLNLLGIKKGAGALGNIISGGAAGAAFDAGVNLEQGQQVQPGIGTALGAGFPAAGALKRVTVRFGKSQAPRIVNSLIKPLLKDFSYGKNPGRAVAEEGIVANTFEELEKNIRARRQEIGQAIGDLGSILSTKASQTEGNVGLDIRKSLSPLTEAAKEAARQNNPTLLKRILDVKTAITDTLEPHVDEAGNIGIQSTGKRKLDKLDFSEARDVLGEVGDLTKFTGNPSDDQLINGALKKVYGNIKGATIDHARKIDPEVAKEFGTLTEKYADLHSAEIATKYRDKIAQRQNLIGLTPQVAGIGTALLTFAATGGAATPAILAGVGGAVVDKLLTTPAFKTRLASILSGKTTEELIDLFKKAPILSKFFPEGGLRSPGDLFLDHIDELPNKQGGFVSNPLSRRNIAPGDAADIPATNGEWPTTASKPSVDENISTGNAPTERRGVSAQRADTSVPFGGASLKPVYEAFDNYKQSGINLRGAEHADELFSTLAKNKKVADAIANESRASIKVGQKLYRAGDKDGISWTTERAVAERFADGRAIQEITVTPEIQSRIVATDEVLSKYKKDAGATAHYNKYHDGELLRDENGFRIPRGESEVILRPASPSIPKELEPLAAEARKYKSAEEFVKAQPVIYHGTPEKFSKFNTNKSEGNATWFTADKKDIIDNTAGAAQPAGKKLNIMERYVKPEIKLATPEQADQMYTDQLIAEGYRGVKYPKGEYGDYEWTKLFFPNEDTLTAKQLTDFYKKATGKN